jgi:hypothetical protein
MTPMHCEELALLFQDEIYFFAGGRPPIIYARFGQQKLGEGI